MASATPEKTPPDEEDQPVIDQRILELFKRKATLSLLKKLNVTSIPPFFEFLFLKRYAYDTICFCKPDPKSAEPDTADAKWLLRKECYKIIYSYIVKRATAISLIEADGYRIIDGWKSLTDQAWVEFVKAFTSKNKIVKIPEHGRTIMSINAIMEKMWEIFTEKPMKFRVQEKVPGPVNTMYAVVTITDTQPKGRFETKWEYMPPTVAEILHPDSDYVFDPKRSE